MALTMEEMEVIVGVSVAYGALANRDASEMNNKDLAFVERVCERLASVLEALETIGGNFEVDLSDPETLRTLANEIDAEQIALEDEAREHALRLVRTGSCPSTLGHGGAK